MAFMRRSRISRSAGKSSAATCLAISLACSAEPAGSYSVARPKDTREEAKLLIEQLVDALLRPILEVEEIDHRHVDLLPVAVAAADALLDPLRFQGRS